MSDTNNKQPNEQPEADENRLIAERRTKLDTLRQAGIAEALRKFPPFSMLPAETVMELAEKARVKVLVKGGADQQQDFSEQIPHLNRSLSQPDFFRGCGNMLPSGCACRTYNTAPVKS